MYIRGKRITGKTLGVRDKKARAIIRSTGKVLIFAILRKLALSVIPVDDNVDLVSVSSMRIVSVSLNHIYATNRGYHHFPPDSAWKWHVFQPLWEF